MYNKELQKQIQESNKLIQQITLSKTYNQAQNFRKQAIKKLDQFLSNIDIIEYLLIDGDMQITKDTFIDLHFNLGTLYKNYIEELAKNNESLDKRIIEEFFNKSLNCFRTVLRVDIEHENSITQIVSVYTKLCYFYKDDTNKCITYLREALFFATTDPIIHYNLGFIYSKLNHLEQAIVHFKLSIELSKDNANLQINNYNSIASLFKSIKQWPEALHYLLKGEKLDDKDPDIQNQLGLVYTEMRRTDLAEIAYNKAIDNYSRSFISTDKNTFLSDIYLNYGHMSAYNGDNIKAIEFYNKSLKTNPDSILPFQNKLMNLNYIFDELSDDRMYIYNQHNLVNKLYKKGSKTFNSEFFNTNKINIGIISGDFVEHPVSYFLNTFLSSYPSDKFNMTCYSECIINTEQFKNNVQFKFIRNLSAEQVSDVIYNDNIHVLFDLAGHTAFNRLDVFAMKPAPIQISYIGYPYSTGLKEMDYRITDNYCDNREVSEKFYIEKLIYMNNCFLCYDAKNVDIMNGLSITKEQPKLKNKFITIGCYNRLNKITKNVIALFNKILCKFDNVRFVFKTKALLNNSIKQSFLENFDKTVIDRITIMKCTSTHNEHLLTYNDIDIAIDTFSYSGTTTSCESLVMGVPVITLYDSEYYFHAQNVTASILHNSDLSEYVANSKNKIIDIIEDLHQKDEDFWMQLKINIHNKFVNGKVCNKSLYINNLSEVIEDLFNKHKSQFD